MSEHIKKTILDLRAKIDTLQQEIIGYKRTVNLLCDQVGMAHAYSGAELASGSPSLSAIRPDTFYGQPLNTSVRKILEMRQAQDLGPASASEIYDALDQGGYQFGASNRDNAIRGLRISLGKSSHTFHKLPNGSYGLAVWYPEVKPSKSKSGIDETESAEEDELELDGPTDESNAGDGE